LATYPFRGEVLAAYLAEAPLAVAMVYLARFNVLFPVLLLPAAWTTQVALGRLVERHQAAAAALASTPSLSQLADRILPLATTEYAPLTPRETQILRWIAGGASNKQVAREHGITVNTVERHVANIYAKTGVQGRAEAALLALRLGLFDEPRQSLSR